MYETAVYLWIATSGENRRGGVVLGLIHPDHPTEFIHVISKVENKF